MFVEITDFDRAWDLKQAGLLWEGYACANMPRSIAAFWSSAEHMRSCHTTAMGPDSGFRFYIQLEE